MALRAPTSFMESMQLDDEDEFFGGGLSSDEDEVEVGERTFVEKSGHNAISVRATAEPEVHINGSSKSIRVSEDILDRVDAVRKNNEDAFGEPVASSKFVRSAALNQGPQAADFRIDGLSMDVPNPEFEAAQELYDAATRRLRINQIARDQARRWVLDSERAQTIKYATSVSARQNLDAIEQDVREVFLNASYVRKPAPIAERRNAQFVMLFETQAIGQPGNSPLDAAIEDILSEEDFEIAFQEQGRRELLQELADGVRDRFRDELANVDYSEFPVTVGELEATFYEHLSDELVRMRREEAGVNALPFEAESDFDREERTQYNAETVQASAVPQMRDVWFARWLNEARILDPNARGIDARLAQVGGAISGAERQRLQRYVNSLVTGDESGQSEVLPHVALRGRSIMTETDVINRFAESVVEVFRLEAIVSGLAPRPEELSAAELAQLRTRAQQRIYSANPTDEALQTKRVRTLMESEHLRRQTEADIARLDYETRKLQPTVSVPKVVVRDQGSSQPFTLTARLVEVNRGAQGQAVAADPNAEHTFRWYFQRLDGSGQERLVREQGLPAGDEPVDTLDIVPTAAPGQDAYLDGSQAGLYRVVIERSGGSSFASSQVTLKIKARCVRCDGTFELGAGEARSFGECEWRAKPINEQLLAYRDRPEFRSYVEAFGSPAGGGAGSGNGYDWRPELDDSVVDLQTQRMIIDDRALINLSTLGSNVLRQRYFVFESVVENIMRRLTAQFAKDYGDVALKASRELFASRTPLSNADEAFFVGMIYAMLDPPAVSAFETAEQALEPVQRAYEEANQFFQDTLADADDVTVAAAEQVLNETRSEVDKTDRFRRDVLQRASNVLNSLDARLNLVSNAVLAAADATAVARSVAEVPLVAILQAGLSPTNPLRLRRSEVRFFGDVASSFGAFADLYRAAAPTASFISDADRRRVRRTGQPIVVIGARPAMSEYRDGPTPTGEVRALEASAAGFTKARRRLDDAQRLYAEVNATASHVDPRSKRLLTDAQALKAAEEIKDEAERNAALREIESRVAIRQRVRENLDRARAAVVDRPTNYRAPNIRFNQTTVARESVRVADAQLASMSAADVRTSTAWSFASRRSVSLKESDAHDMFVDERGLIRLHERMASATVRTNIETRGQKFIDESYTEVGDLARQDLDLSRALGKPLGVELELWQHLGTLAMQQGVAYTADLARKIARMGGLEHALGVADWRGVHSSTNTQPDAYTVSFTEPVDQPGSRASRRRGSERLTAGYNFSSINARIERLVAEYNGAPSKDVRERIIRVALYFNVLAQFAPKMRSRAVLSVDDIERVMADLTSPAVLATVEKQSLQQSKRRRLDVALVM